jgi:hypothetical protein
LRDKDNLGLLATLGISQGQFPVINIPGRELEHLVDSHPAAGHQSQQQAVSRFHSPEDDLIDDLLFENRPMGDLGRSEQLPEHRGAAGVFKIGIDSISNQVEEGRECSVARPLGRLFGPFGTLPKNDKTSSSLQ